MSVDIIANGNGCGRKWRKRFRSRTGKSAANERASKDEKDKSALGKARMGEVRMKGENEGEEEERRMKSKRERESVEHPCGGRQVSGCARFTLAFANGDTSRRKGESESLLSSG